VADSTGTWYIKISRSSGEGEYQLSIDIQDQNDAESGQDAGDSYQGAIPISTGTITGLLKAGDDNDYYSINLEEGQQITLQLTIPGNAQYGVLLLNPNNNSRGSSITQREIKTLDYVADSTGTWYIKISRSSGEGEYQLSVNTSFGGAGEPGNHSPVISSVNAAQESIEINNYVNITCSASDQDGDTLIFSWAANGQVIEGNNSSLSWRAPDTAGTYTITCTLNDSKGGQDSESVSITVTTPSGPISTDDIIYLNSPHQIITADFGDSDGSKSVSSGGWSDYSKANRSCRAYSLGAGFVFTGGSASYWSKVGKIFDVQQGTYISSSRVATITINGTYSGRIMAAILATSNANLKVVVTDNGTVVASSEIFNESGTLVTWNSFNGSFSESLTVTLWAGHAYCVYLNLETSATAAILGSAGADVGEGGKYAGYGGIDISF
jgi:hypothetical protein